jgi:peptide deformylase
MPELVIKKFPDPFLRKKASKVPKVTSCERDILAEMAKLMYLSQGVGLAAIQVGVNKQLVVIDVGSGLINFINPVIVKRDGRESLEEGCLSVPGINVKIRRSKTIMAHFLDEYGNARQMHADGLLARAIQHEMDHLAGTLIIDYVNPVKKILLRRALTKRK